jgi:putative membrane protein
MPVRLAFLAATLALASLPALAQQTSIPAPAISVSKTENAAATYLVQDSVGDVQLGKLALEKSRNASVRSFAQTLVNDHTQTFEQGMRAARTVGATEAKVQPSDEAQITLHVLSKNSGSDFDHEFLTDEISSHQNDIETIRNAVAVTTNPTLKQAEQNTLQIDEKHLRLANQALDEVTRNEQQ